MKQRPKKSPTRPRAKKQPNRQREAQSAMLSSEQPVRRQRAKPSEKQPANMRKKQSARQPPKKSSTSNQTKTRSIPQDAAAAPLRLTVRPLTLERWSDLEQLFGERGACGGCWCMWWRRSPSEFAAGRGDGNKRALRRLVSAGETPGLLAYDGRKAVGWCAFAPREQYPRLARSRTLAPVDDQPVWSVTCFFVEKAYRRSGLTRVLLEAARVHAHKQGGKILEGYPVDLRGGPFVFTGLQSAFKKTGFVEVMRRSKTRPIMRCVLST